MRNIDRGERIGATHFEPIAGRERFERFSGPERRERAVEPRQIEFGNGHAAACAADSWSVNRWRGRRIGPSRAQRAAAVKTDDRGAPGVVLAGGLARRMGGGDKPMREIGGRTILARVIARLEPQCECLAINANCDPRRFESFGLPVIADGVKDHPGPLAGILAGLDWAAANRPNAAWVLSAPGDCPFLPRDLVARLSDALLAENAELAVASSQGRSHPVIGLWSVGLRDALREALVVEGLRKVGEWTARYRFATVGWPAEPFDPFFNVNTLDDLAEAERLAAIDDRA
jgi:molybdenum cofactor guanylyltransferase